jgi:hypothetical protein
LFVLVLFLLNLVVFEFIVCFSFVLTKFSRF